MYNSFTESLNYLNLSLYTFSGRHSAQSLINKSKSWYQQLGNNWQREVYSYLHFTLYVSLIPPIHRQWASLKYEENYRFLFARRRSIASWSYYKTMLIGLTAVIRNMNFEKQQIYFWEYCNGYRVWRLFVTFDRIQCPPIAFSSILFCCMTLIAFSAVSSAQWTIGSLSNDDSDGN